MMQNERHVAVLWRVFCSLKRRESRLQVELGHDRVTIYDLVHECLVVELFRSCQAVVIMWLLIFTSFSATIFWNVT